jgi:hypothetical protein
MHTDGWTDRSGEDNRHIYAPANMPKTGKSKFTSIHPQHVLPITNRSKLAAPNIKIIFNC